MKMRFCVLLCLLLQVLGGSGLPLFELSSKADDALRMALNQINARYARLHLYRVSKASVKKIVPLEMDTYDLFLRFGIRETACQKNSGLDPQGCMYRKSFFVSEAGCYIRVRVAQQVTTIISLRCTHADSSSSESSEERRLEWTYDSNHFGTRDHTRATLAPRINVAPPLHSDQHNNRETSNVRGDNFSNHLPFQ
ncbi:secreted phosphoprotein 24 [Xyrauchen texanus]|uniref:secreted phosphoprotein 24 n=1 Tax=Xyrauchen texanus TaxID=154827 RepID=UPI002241B8BF|nr:secreted phosphoprotein 24 [Xyrauchen texanus]